MHRFLYLLSLMCKFGSQAPGVGRLWRGGGEEKGDATIIRRHLARCNPLQNQALGFLNLHHRFPLVYNRKGVAFSVMGWGEHFPPHRYTTTPRAWCHRGSCSGGSSWHSVADVRMTREIWLGVGREPCLVREVLSLTTCRTSVVLLG